MKGLIHSEVEGVAVNASFWSLGFHLFGYSIRITVQMVFLTRKPLEELAFRLSVNS